MAEALGPGIRNDPLAPDLSLEERLRALEAAWAESLPGQPGAGRGLADYAARLEALAAEVAQQRERLRDQEKALVERIADVDDDRRLTSSKLQRGWQTQREEFEVRLRRHGRLTVLMLVLALAGSGLFALYAHFQAPPASLAEEVATLRRDVQRLSGVARQDAELQERLATLSAAVGKVSSTVQRTPPRPDGPALTDRLDRLTAEQRRQDTALEALQRGLQALVAGTPSPPPGPSADRPPAAASESHPPKSVAPDAAPTPAIPHTRKATVGDRPFALQLSSGRNRDTILELAARPNLPDRVYVYEDVRRGRPWFVLIHSLHGTNAEARAALAQIPQTLRTQTPWIRALPSGADLEVIEHKAGHN